VEDYPAGARPPRGSAAGSLTMQTFPTLSARSGMNFDALSTSIGLGDRIRSNA
jgi:hypothetical protein